MNEFNPNWTTPPGSTILDWMEETNISLYELYELLNISSIKVLELLEDGEPYPSKKDWLYGNFCKTDEVIPIIEKLQKEIERQKELRKGCEQAYENISKAYQEEIENRTRYNLLPWYRKLFGAKKW